MRLTSLVIVAVAAGCGGPPAVDSAPLAGPGALTLSADSLEFGGLPLGSSAAQSLELANTGESPLAIYDVVFGDDTLRIHWGIEGLTTVAVAPGEVHALEVRFAPVAIGQLDVNLRVLSDDPEGPTQQVTLRGEGLGEPALWADPLALDFGTVTIGQRVEQSVALANFGTAPLVLGETDITTNATDYEIVVDPGGSTLAPGDENGLLVVGFEPHYDGPLYGTLSIRSNDPELPLLEIPLSGEGEPPG